MKHLLQYYFRRIYLWSIRKRFPYWWMRLHCNICGKNVFKHKGDYYCLKPEIWEKIIDNPFMSTKYIICKKCGERLLGRKFTKDDYYQPEDDDPNHGQYN